MVTKTHVVEVEEQRPVSIGDKQTLTNRAECVERVHGYINTVVPALLTQLEQGFKLKTCGSLYQKDRDALDYILAHSSEKLSQGHEGRRASSAYMRSDQYSIYLEVQDAYPSLKGSTPSHEYYKKTIYLWSNQNHTKQMFAPLPFHTGEALILAKERLQIVNAIISKMNDEASGLKMLIGSNY